RLMGFMTLLQMTMGYFYTYYSIYFTSFEGGSVSLLGLAFLISSVSETPFLLLSDRLVRKPGVGKLLVISGCVLTLRWILLASATSVYTALFSQVLHSWGFIVMTVSMAKYINLHVPDELKARGQMLLNVAGFGVARVFGIIIGGAIAASIGVRNGFWASAAISTIALILFAPHYLKEKQPAE
ncbi:MAG: MFS transporter, partial [Clostridia bacterium]|nr:MFS transporter [Clostridia bacterium]